MSPRLRKIRSIAAEWVDDILINGVAGNRLIPRQLRWAVYQALGMPIARCHVAAGVFLSRNVTIGERAFINSGCFLDGTGGLRIGSRVALGPGVKIVTGSHYIGSPSDRRGASKAAPVEVGDGSWIGANVTILPGVSIGSGVVIGAGSLVTKDCQADGLYMGSPADRVRDLPSTLEQRVAAPG